MDAVTGPAMESLPEDAHLLVPVLDRAEREPDRPVAAHRVGPGFQWITAAEFATRVRKLAKGLVATGVAPGDRVALMSRTRLEWPLVDYAILMAGGVTVPIYDTSSAEQVSWILADSGAVLTVLETRAHLDLYEHAGLTHRCCEALVIDDGGLEELIRRGAGVPDTALDDRLGRLRTADLATIVYTSGTTGRPKGCLLTHGNLRTNVRQVLEAAESFLGPDETTLLFLPLAHTLARAIWLVGVEHEECFIEALRSDVADVQGARRPRASTSPPWREPWNSCSAASQAWKPGTTPCGSILSGPRSSALRSSRSPTGTIRSWCG